MYLYTLPGHHPLTPVKIRQVYTAAILEAKEELLENIRENPRPLIPHKRKLEAARRRSPAKRIAGSSDPDTGRPSTAISRSVVEDGGVREIECVQQEPIHWPVRSNPPPLPPLPGST